MTVNEIIDLATASGRRLLFADEAATLLKAVGIPVVPCRVAQDEQEAVRAAAAIGYPVALKVRSPEIVHKSEAGGVCLGLVDESAVRNAYRQIIDRARTVDQSAQVTVHPMVPPGVELLIGMITDAQFGQVVAFGLGGIFVEMLDDITFRQVPLLEKDALDMLESIKGCAILKGYRGSKPVDTNAISEIILSISKLVQHYPRIREIDLNPVFAYPDGVLVIDARVIVF
ncbi:MAG: succinyl-CoA synthetase subunit beta [Pelotomaculum sp. PtaB.Bin104]|nr:MAG: succinyl-CoA synthetase subunit beta [Pelotomaculum sp. PtaB.Bin104]